MPEVYSKPCQISKMMRHIENPGMVRTVIHTFLGIFKDIQQYSALRRHIK